jgi:hypothetical protein
VPIAKTVRHRQCLGVMGKVNIGPSTGGCVETEMGLPRATL